MKYISIVICVLVFVQLASIGTGDNQIITGSIDRPVLVGSIDPPPRILNCEGIVRLQTINESRILNDLPIFASEIRIRTGKKRTIWKKGYELATVEGSCCWKAWSSKRGGSFHVMKFAGVHKPGFTIRRIELLEDCQ